MPKTVITHILLSTLLANTPPALPQTSTPSTDATHLTFDVVSIKRNHSGPGPTMIISPPESDRIIVRNAPVRTGLLTDLDFHRLARLERRRRCFES